MDKIQVFSHEQLGTVRTLIINGAPWFVGKDVCIALGYSDTDQAIRKHVDDEDKQIFKPVDLTGLHGDATFTIDSPRGYTFINESGLYSLILSSKLPRAKDFKRWVTAEVLPSIRQSGSYSVDNSKIASGNSREQLFNRALDCLENLTCRFQNICSCERDAAIAMAVDVTEQLYQFDLHFLLIKKFQNSSPCTCSENTDGTMNATELGRYFGCSAVEMNKRLEREGYVTKDATGDWIPTKIGAPFAKLTPCTKTRRGYYIRWKTSILINMHPDDDVPEI